MQSEANKGEKNSTLKEAAAMAKEKTTLALLSDNRGSKPCDLSPIRSPGSDRSGQNSPKKVFILAIVDSKSPHGRERGLPVSGARAEGTSFCSVAAARLVTCRDD